ncbi:MAG TPA: hypothetical protein VFK41_13145 [Nocardioidaceae bacterium]|nr:hypothetical protein [Nocardioidaceae bacterium]
MTATIERHETRTTQTTTTTAVEPAALLTTLYAAIAAVADIDPDVLGSDRAAGRDLLGLAGAARAAVAALGRNPGHVVTDAPGVVVVRELVAATRALAAATADPAYA